jgi:hypothetical protein
MICRHSLHIKTQCLFTIRKRYMFIEATSILAMIILCPPTMYMPFLRLWGKCGGSEGFGDVEPGVSGGCAYAMKMLI